MESALYDKLSEPNFSNHALKVLEKRYLQRDDNNQIIENPKGMLYRVASTIANGDLQYGSPKEDVEKLTGEFYRVMADGYFLPNSPTLRGAGIHSNLAACFVLPVYDSRESIFEETLFNAVKIQAFGGGTGFNWSELRHDGALISSTKGKSAGPVSFINVYDIAIGETIAQGGVRQGANMGILNYNHPDILKFIRSKSELNKKHKELLQRFKETAGLDDSSKYVGILEELLVSKLQLTNFNLSVGVTEEFMKLAREGKDYNLIDHRNQVAGKLNAREVLEEIIKSAWKKGDPGIIFLDRIDRDNATPSLGKIVATNPCGEQPLLPYEACNLGSINLAAMVNGNGIDYELLEKTIRTGVHFLDNVIDVNTYVVGKIEEMTKGNRKIGLGVMGFGDMLVQLGIPYASEEGISKAEEVMSFINEKAHEVSQNIAKVKGAFPNFEKSIYAGGVKIRNAKVTTIAPTGTLSLLYGVTSGIEPLFALYYERGSVYDSDGKAQVVEKVANPYLEKMLRERTSDYEKIIEHVKQEGSIQSVRGVSEDIKKLFLRAEEIDLEYHLRMQSAFQKHVDNAVSKTINLHKNATVGDVAKAFWLSYDLPDIKGLTVYRDGSKGSQVLTAVKEKPKERSIEELLKDHPESELVLSLIRQKTGGGSIDDFLDKHPVRGRNVPDTFWLPGATRQVKTGCGPIFVTINEDKYGVVEVFTNMNPAGGCADAQTATCGILASGLLQNNGDPYYVIRHLNATNCPKKNDIAKEKCCPQAVSEAVKEYIDIRKLSSDRGENPFFKDAVNYNELKKVESKGNGNREHEPILAKSNKDGFNRVDAVCPECGMPLQFGEGCRGGKCGNIDCGYANCG